MSSSSLHDGIPDRRTRILGRLAAARNEGRPPQALPLPEEDPQLLLDHVWTDLESQLVRKSSTPSDRINLRRQCLKIAQAHDIFPTSVLLTNVKCWEKVPRRSGGFADVFLGKIGDIPVAIKRIRWNTSTSKEERNRVTKGLSHQNILPCIGVSDDVFEHTTCIIMQWMPKTIIEHRQNILNANGGAPLPEHFKRIVDGWLHEVALGLAYLHEEGIVHGDLHGRNILVDERGHLRLADFGTSLIANATPHGYASNHRNGAVRWAAPELMDHNLIGVESSRPTAASDVYSFGRVCVEISTGDVPFPALTDLQVMAKVLAGINPPRPFLLDGEAMEDALWELVESCWSSNPQLRPQSGEIVHKVDQVILGLGPGPSHLPAKASTFACAITDVSEPRFGNYAFSATYLVAQSSQTLLISSLPDLKDWASIDEPLGPDSTFAIVSNTLAIVHFPAPGSAIIRIWDLAERRCCRTFALAANDVQIFPAVWDISATNPFRTTRSAFVFIVSQHNQTYDMIEDSIGVLTLPHEFVGDQAQGPQPLMESEHYWSFSFINGIKLTCVGVLGEIAVAGCSDSTIWQWNVADKTCMGVFSAGGIVRSISFDLLNGMACALTKNGYSVVWSTGDPPNPGDVRSRFLPGFPQRVAIHDQFVIALLRPTGSLQYRAHVFTHDFQPLRSFSHDDGDITDFQTYRKALVTISRDWVKVWNISTGQEIQSFYTPSMDWQDVAEDPGRRGHSPPIHPRFLAVVRHTRQSQCLAVLQNLSNR